MTGVASPFGEHDRPAGGASRREHVSAAGRRNDMSHRLARDTPDDGSPSDDGLTGQSRWPADTTHDYQP